MGLVVENSIRFNHVCGDIINLADGLNETLGEDTAVASYEEGSEEDPTALVFLDIPSFMTLDNQDKKLFESALKESDAVNFVILGGMVRITFAIQNYWKQEEEPFETNVIELVKK